MKDNAERRPRNGSRHRARRRAVELLYEAEVRDLDPVALAGERAGLAREPGSGVRPVAEYTRHLLTGAAVELDDLDRVIAANLAEDWELGRLAATDRAVLRLSCWELLFNPEVPAQVAVSEGVALVGEFSGESSVAWCNALLDAVARTRAELRREIAARRDPAGARRLAEGPVSAEDGVPAGETAPADATGEASDDAAAAGESRSR